MLRVSDNGVGFEVNETSDKGKTTKSVGSYNLKYRANLIGGNFELKSRPGQGTQAELIVPYNAAVV